MLSQLLPLPLFWDLMGLFIVGLVGFIITWYISHGLAWLAASVGAGVMAVILALALILHLAGLPLVDGTNDFLFTMLFWLILHLGSALAFMRRVRRRSGECQVADPEPRYSPAPSFTALALRHEEPC